MSGVRIAPYRKCAMMTEKEFNRRRKDARHFFEDLERHLNQSVPPPAALRKEVEDIRSLLPWPCQAA